MSSKVPLHIFRAFGRSRFSTQFQRIGKGHCGMIKDSHIFYLSCNNFSSAHKNPGLLKKLSLRMKWFEYSKSVLRAGGFKLYENIADRVRHEEFFEALGIPDTLFSWFLVIELHVWMVMARLMAEDEGRFVRNILVEAMWEDVRTRVKKLEDNTASNIQKSLQELSQQFGAAIIGYDEGLLGDDRCLAGALWRRIFQQKYGTAMSLELLVKYVRQQMCELDQLNREEILLRPNLKWNSLVAAT